MWFLIVSERYFAGWFQVIKFLLYFVFLFSSANVFSASFAIPPESSPSVMFDIESQTVSGVFKLVYTEAFKQRSYVLNPAILQDQRLVSFRYSPKDGDFWSFWSYFLKGLGYTVDKHGSTDVVNPVPVLEKPSLAEDSTIELFVYKPRFRDGSYLVETLTPLFRGKFTTQRAISSSVPVTQAAAPDSALGQVSKLLDQLLFYGSSKEVSVLRKLLPQLDTETPQVLVNAFLYEVQNLDSKGSALGLVGSILAGRFSVAVGAPSKVDNFLSLKVGDLSAVLSVLDNDSRFKVISSPQLRVSSGRSATFTVGDEVPVLGATSYPPGGVPVQSVDYRSSGVIFTIAPIVRDGVVDLHLDQQVSSFVATTTGVNNSPTLTKRQLATDLSLTDDEIVVVGGLRQNKDASGSSGLSVFRSKSSSSSSTDILLLVQVKRL